MSLVYQHLKPWLVLFLFREYHSVQCLYYPNLHLTVKKVTIPVTVVAPTETPVVPVPTTLNDSLVTPIVYEPSIPDDVVVPDMLTMSRFSRECGEDDSTL